MAYRNDVDALEARHRALEAELAERTRERDDVARMLSEARAREIEDAARIDAATGGPARRRRRRILLAATLVAMGMIAGFGYRAHHHRCDRNTRAMERFRALADEMCRCSDTSCATRVGDRMSSWASQAAPDAPRPSRLDEATARRMTEIARRYTRCLTRAMTGSVEAAEQALTR